MGIYLSFDQAGSSIRRNRGAKASLLKGKRDVGEKKGGEIERDEGRGEKEE